MGKNRTTRNTVGTALSPPESTTSQGLGIFTTLREAIDCVRRGEKKHKIKAVGITSLMHIHLKIPPDSRPLIADDSFERFEFWFAPLYPSHERFVVRIEDVPMVSNLESSVHPRMAVIVCLKAGERLEDITDIKEQ